MNMPSYIRDNRGNLILKKEIFTIEILSKLKMVSNLNKILSDFTKIKILFLLSHGEANVTSIVKDISVSQSLISHHLATLRHCNLVVSKKVSKTVYYSLTPLGKSALEKYVG